MSKELHGYTMIIYFSLFLIEKSVWIVVCLVFFLVRLLVDWGRAKQKNNESGRKFGGLFVCPFCHLGPRPFLTLSFGTNPFWIDDIPQVCLKFTLFCTTSLFWVF